MKALLLKFIEKYFPGWEKRLKIGHRSGADRRTDILRRRTVSEKYYEDKTINQRLTIGRRQSKERRSHWSRGTKWASSFYG